MADEPETPEIPEEPETLSVPETPVQPDTGIEVISDNEAFAGTWGFSYVDGNEIRLYLTMAEDGGVSDAFDPMRGIQPPAFDPNICIGDWYSTC